MRIRILLLVGIGACLPTLANAQSLRYELGQRLQRTEDAWAKHADEAAKKRAFTPLISVFTSFVMGDFPEAARNLDKTRYALLNEKPSDAQRWADAVMVSVMPRLVGAKNATIQVDLRTLYKPKVEMPKGLSWRVGIAKEGKAAKLGNTKPLTLPIKTKRKDVPKGKSLVVVEILSGGKTLLRKTYPVYAIPNLKERLASLDKSIDKLGEKTTTETATAKMLFRQLRYLQEGYLLEMDYPADRLLEETEAVAVAAMKGKQYYNKTRPGQFWLRVVTPKGALHHVRLFVPKSVKKGKRVPMIVALHGVGASENIFFDAYNRGELVRLCKKRGWMLMAPRTLGFSFTTPTPAIIDALAKRYPIDRDKVFLLGHSMGASQAIAVVESHPKTFAGVAALGGSRPVRKPKNIQHIPFFIGVGDKDFAAGGAKRLAKDLKLGGVNSVDLRIHPNVEHIMIVQESYPEVMAFFDKIAKGKD